MVARKALIVITALSCLVMCGVRDASAAVTSSWDQNIEVTVTESHKLLAFSMRNPVGGIGTELNPYTTFLATVPLNLTAAGVGDLIITDDGGNELWYFTKTSLTTDNLIATVSLLNGLGLYELTATFVETGNPSVVYDTLSIFVKFLETTIPTMPPATPETGIIYIGDRAFLVRDFAMVIGAGAIIAVAVMVARNKKRTS